MAKSCLKVALWTLFSVGAFAQGGYYTNFTWSVAAGSIGGQPSSVITQPGAAIHVCVAPANATPCTNYASIYSDIGLTTPITQPGFVSDAYGNFGFYANSGNYQYTVTYGGTSSDPYPVTMPIASNASVIFSSIASRNIGAVRYADQFSGADCGAKINAADVDLGATTGEIWVNRACGTAWTTTLNLSSTASRVLRIIQGGTYTVSATILPTGKLSIYCSGGVGLNSSDKGTCILAKSNAFTGNLLTLTTVAQGSVIDGVTFDGNKVGGATGDGVQIYGNSVTVRNSAAINNAGNGFTIGKATTGGNANSLNFNAVRSSNNGGHGYYFKDFDANANAGTYTNVVAQSNTGDGVRFDSGTVNNTFYGYLGESNTGYGIHQVAGAEPERFYGGDINEDNTAGPIKIEAGANTTGQSIFMLDIGATAITDSGTFPSVLWSSQYGLTNLFIGGTSAQTAVVLNLFNTVHERDIISWTNAGGGVYSKRWIMQIGDGVGETGGNAGSNFNLLSRDDTGLNIGTALAIVRSTMAATFGGAATITGALNANGGLKVGSSGTSQTQVLNCAGAITPASVNATTCAEQTFTIGACSGLATTDTIKVNQSTANTTLAFPVGDWRVSSAGVIARTYCNPTAGALTPTAQTLKIWAIH